MIIIRWSDEITLLATVEPESEQEVDAHGFTAEAQEQRTEVFANIHSAGANEFYKAQQAGTTITLKADVHTEEYDGQTAAEYDGKRYKITRTYQNDNGEITELTLSDQKEGA